MILIPLKKACKTSDDIIALIKSIFSDIKGEAAPISFSIAKEIKKSDKGRFTDALMLEPNFAGLGLKLPQLFKWLAGKG
jgi:hypothetical protein